MRKIFLAWLVSALVATLAPLGHSVETKFQLVRVKVDNRAEAAFVAERFDENHEYDPGHVQVLLWPGDAYRLESLGFDFEVLIDDVVAHDQRALEEAEANTVLEPMPGPDRTDYRTLADYNAEMVELAKKNPSLVKLLKLPQVTHEGRTVLGVEIAKDVKSDDGRPVLYVDGIHHAREWPAAEYPMIFAHYLVERFGKDADVTKLLTQGRVIVVPVVNPDGFDYSRSSPLAMQATVDSAHGQGCGVAHCEAYWRKNRRSYTGVTVPGIQKNPDAYGVDPNRNYSYHWGGGGSNAGVSIGGQAYLPHPIADQTYRGPTPQSEPETQNVNKLILKNNVTTIITNHTSGRLVLRPWGDTYLNTPDEKYHFDLGARMAKAMGGYQNIKGIQLYVTTGTMSEWGYGTLGIPSYTFEHGRAFHPPYAGCAADCVQKEWPGVVNAFMIAGEAALDSSVHGILRGRIAGGSATLTISKKIKNPLDPTNPIGEKDYTHKYTTSIKADGSFVWHLPPSTQPRLKEKGETDTYTLTVAGNTYTFVLRQGQVIDLGTINV